jgi:hypothetical protein
MPGFKPTNAISNSRRLLIFPCLTLPGTFGIRERKGKGKRLKWTILGEDFNDSGMLKSLLRDRLLLLLLLTAILLRWFSGYEDAVERYYARGFYPPFSQFLRALQGWIPFSLGDILYAAAFIYLVAKVLKFTLILKRRKMGEYLSWILMRKFIRLVLWVFVVFHVFWGLNYYRRGVAEQFNLEVSRYSTEEVYRLTRVFHERLCIAGEETDSLQRLRLRKNRVLFGAGIQAYKAMDDSLPFLAYRNPSIKPSLYTPFGHYFGFTGYYNPFSGEAQMKTTVPVFIQPFVTCHEIAHQLGYAKENEANFIAYLVAKGSEDPEFRYSAYYEMFAYASRELSKRDPKLAHIMIASAHPQFRRDTRIYYDYLDRNRNSVEPFISDFYSGYLKFNNQPSGLQSYNEVVAWLVAYMKKEGEGSL